MKKRWLLLLFLNLLLFNSPAGDCGADLATGFPLILGHLNHETNAFTFSGLALFVDILTTIVFVLLLAQKIVIRFSLNFTAAKYTIIYFFLTNMVCAFSLVFQFKSKLYEYFLAPFTLFYVPGLYLSNLNFNQTIAHRDELAVFARLGLLPSLLIFYFFFGFIIKLAGKIKKYQNLPDNHTSR